MAKLWGAYAPRVLFCGPSPQTRLRPGQNNETALESSPVRRGAKPCTRGGCAPQIAAIVLLGLASVTSAATLQERIDAAAPNETIRVESGVHSGAIVINKPLSLVGDPGAEFVVPAWARS